ncbi:unnamed protein product [Rotaria socialis]|uniref:Vacuolar protein sorting-associated protein 8 central domain-containing protein n=1 Tax=Rotaria socialis TaxID=392032 RepID=A0A817RJ72_9BILA|nr:unnamed protein product [Rotaria socialis]CAF3250205.1 unnamed protein product [Rotaria socialis]CAF3346906.1 unnamed protein product [Rotaria socialis]CAF3382357.1 unnamed protein product [Rotaria socialis]CAF3752266.1 unnamed protein product [Rotaria socialis]
MSDLIGEKNAILSLSKDGNPLLDDFDLTPSSIDDNLFDIPVLTSLPSLESILYEADPALDSISLTSSLQNQNFQQDNENSPNNLTNINSSELSSISFDSSLETNNRPLDNYILKIHHQQQDAISTDESFVEVHKHTQINHGSLLKIQELETVSNQISLCIERTNYGHPTTIDVLLHRMIAIGTTKSVVLLFEHQTQTLKHCLNSDLTNGAVSALNFNSDGTRLLVGYARGRIQMYDCSNGKLLRNISNDIHGPDTAILNIKFTHDPTVAVFSDSGGSVYVLQFTRHLKRGYQSKCLFSGSRGEVCTLEPLLFYQQHGSLTTDTNEKLEQHPLKSMYIIALATFTKIFLLALKSQNNVKILRVQHLVGSNTTLPILKWQFIIVKVSDNVSCINPILAAVRDRQCTFIQIQHVRDDELHLTQLKQITVDYHIKSFCWLNARTFVLFDMSERAHVIDQRSEEQLECLSLSHCELIYNTIFFKSLATGGNVSSALALAGQNACYQTLISSQGCIFLLGTHAVYEIHLRDWSERLDFFIENGKNQYEQALELAYLMLLGKAKGLTGLPIDPVKRRQCISERMVSLLQAYLKYSLNYECPQSGTIDLLKQHYRNVLPRSIDYCLLIDRLDLLFGLIYEIFSKDSIAHGIYLQCLEPYILKNRFDTMSPMVLNDFINYYVENNHLNQLEHCLNRLDVSSLDIDQIIQITRKHNLYMTLLRIYSEAFKDFTAILKEIIEKLEYDIAENNGTCYSAKMTLIGNQALVFIQTTLVGEIYPFGGRLSSDLAQFGRNEIVDFLSFLHPRRTGGLLYSNLRALLHFNTRDFFNLLTMAFDNEEFLNDVDTIKRRAFCDILLRVMVDDVQFSSHQISILFNFLSRQLAKTGQQHIFVQGMLFEQVRN